MDQQTRDTPGKRKRTKQQRLRLVRNVKRIIGLTVGTIVIVVLIIVVLTRVTQPDFSLDVPDTVVRPGDTVSVHSDEECGPLLVRVYAEERFGMWSQTHTGNLFDGFEPDRIPWWRIGATSRTFTPAPCNPGAASFTVPEDVTATRIAVCDQDQRCAKIDVDQS